MLAHARREGVLLVNTTWALDRGRDLHIGFYEYRYTARGSVRGREDAHVSRCENGHLPSALSIRACGSGCVRG